ncbi:hypothetical protein JCM10049v2_007606 [Rhodotorula toruloides]
MHRRTPSSRSVSSSSQPLLPLPSSHDSAHHAHRAPAPRSNPRRTRQLALVVVIALATLVLLARRSAPRDGTSSSRESDTPTTTSNRLSLTRLPSRIKDTASLLLSLRPFSSSSPSLPPPTAPILLAPLARPTEISYAEPWVYEADPATLPPCERILLFTFMPWWGFASEYILYARAAAAAKKLNYTFLEDDRNWNYGRLSNYFLPRTLSCVPPSDWSNPALAIPLSPSSASSSPPHARLKYSRLNLGDIDDWTRETYLSSPGTQADLLALQESDRAHRVQGDRWILGEGETLPEAFAEVFGDQIGLDAPRWLADEEGEGEGRGPVVAVHVRLGDKASEYEHDAEEMGITNSFGNLTVYIEAAHDAYRRLIPSPYPAFTSSSSSDPDTDASARFSPYAPPTLLLITAEPSIPSRLREEVRLADPWRVVQTPGVESQDEGGGAAEERLRKEGGVGGGRPKAYAAAAAAAADTGKMIKIVSPPSPLPRRRRSLDSGYTQQSFNALPLLSRVAHTQAFVRDLTLLARSGEEEEGVDAAVVSGASNVGRLAMLIAGKEAVMGPRDEQTGRPLGGRIRSVDAHFYPTAYSSAVYTKVEDVEDLENKAFVPEEQHRAEVEAQAKAQGRRRRGRGRGRGRRRK